MHNHTRLQCDLWPQRFSFPFFFICMVWLRWRPDHRSFWKSSIIFCAVRSPSSDWFCTGMDLMCVLCHYVSIMVRQCIIWELLHCRSGCWRLNGHRREREMTGGKKIFVNQVNFPCRYNEVWGFRVEVSCVGCVLCEAACSTHTHSALKGYLGCLFIRPERAFPLVTESLTAQER